MMVAEQKRAMRIKMRELKKQLSDTEKQLQASCVFSTIENSTDFANSKVVLCYWSLPDELPTHDFVKKWSVKKKLLLPVMVGSELVVKEYIDESTLNNENAFGVFEPQGDVFIQLHEIDIIIVPGVAFDKNNQRLGRGKGFYDKLLKNSPAKKVGVGFSFQMLETLPVEPHDVALDEVFCGLLK